MACVLNGLLHYRIQQQSGILARCILFCFVAFYRIYMYVCAFFAATSLANKDLSVICRHRNTAIFLDVIRCIDFSKNSKK